MVRDLDRAAAFYRAQLGFAELGGLEGGREGGVARLGVDGREIIRLSAATAAAAPGRTTGLYHVAILLPSRVALADALRHLARTGTPLQGASDHAVSEAVYLADPEGNGIELYRDRARGEWPRRADGAIAMTTQPLDLDGLLAVPGQEGRWRMPAGTTVGHVHLRVADIRAAERFYGDVLGFETTARYGPAACFVSAGGYHHHIGFNTWESAAAPPPPPGAPGLAWFSIVLPQRAALEAALARLRAAGAAPVERDGGWLARDPSGNGVLLTA
jgi:catechol 2,3-dioxygenase